MDENMSLGEWIISMIITAIPCVGIIMLFVWAFGSSTKPSKKTWAQATLILYVVAIVVYAVMFFVMGVSFADLAASGAY